MYRLKGDWQEKDAPFFLNHVPDLPAADLWAPSVCFLRLLCVYLSAASFLHAPFFPALFPGKRRRRAPLRGLQGVLGADLFFRAQAPFSSGADETLDPTHAVLRGWVGLPRFPAA